MSEISDRVRVDWLKGDTERDAGLKTPASVIRYDNISYGPDSKWNILDLYLPKKKAPKNGFPIIISIHGGGYIYGTKEIYQFYGMNMAKRGFAFVNFNYRLAPEAKFPAALEDTNNVVKWVLQKAPKLYPVDTGHIFMVGDSAGGHYNALYSCICTNPSYAKLLKISPPKGFVPLALGLNFGIYDPLAVKDDSDHDAYTQDLMGSKWQEKSAKYLCTPSFVNDDFPPCFLASGSNDFLKHQVPILEQALTEHHIPHFTKIYGRPGEEQYYHVFHCNSKTKEGRIFNDEQARFFKQFL